MTRRFSRLLAALLIPVILSSCTASPAVGKAPPSLEEGPSPVDSQAGDPHAESAPEGDLPGADSAASIGPVDSPPEEGAGQGIPYLSCLYYEENRFSQAAASPRTYLAEGGIQAGVVPHHLLASGMIAGFFALASQGDYDRVLILSPSHYPKSCDSPVVTAAAGWDTPFGRVEPEPGLVGAILADRRIAAQNSPAALERDHGAAGLIPFVRYYLPGVPVAVCLVSNDLPWGRLEALYEVLAAHCADGRTLVVASMDFSHYLWPEEAERRDNETARAVMERDYGRIALFTDSNVDSPQALTLFLRLCDSGGWEVAELDRASSADFLPRGFSHPNNSEGLTTYFVYAALRQM